MFLEFFPEYTVYTNWNTHRISNKVKIYFRCESEKNGLFFERISHIHHSTTAHSSNQLTKVFFNRISSLIFPLVAIPFQFNG